MVLEDVGALSLRLTVGALFLMGTWASGKNARGARLYDSGDVACLQDQPAALCLSGHRDDEPGRLVDYLWCLPKNWCSSVDDLLGGRRGDPLCQVRAAHRLRKDDRASSSGRWGGAGPSGARRVDAGWRTWPFRCRVEELRFDRSDRLSCPYGMSRPDVDRLRSRWGAARTFDAALASDPTRGFESPFVEHWKRDDGRNEATGCSA